MITMKFVLFENPFNSVLIEEGEAILLPPSLEESSYTVKQVLTVLDLPLNVDRCIKDKFYSGTPGHHEIIYRVLACDEDDVEDLFLFKEIDIPLVAPTTGVLRTFKETVKYLTDTARYEFIPALYNITKIKGGY